MNNTEITNASVFVDGVMNCCKEYSQKTNKELLDVVKELGETLLQLYDKISSEEAGGENET